MSFKVPLLKGLQVITDDSGEGSWVESKEFLLFLRNHHLPTDTIKEIKTHNILKELRGHKNGIKEVEWRTVINVSSVFRYIFHEQW